MKRGSSLSLAVRVNARCDQFERAWREGSSPEIEEFASGWKGAARAALLRELVGVDAQYRVESSDEETLPDYSAGFPELGAATDGHVPRELGPYVLLERVGAGGMGTVRSEEHTSELQ